MLAQVAVYVRDLVKAFDIFVHKRDKLHHGVYNIGGGMENTLSLLELLDILEKQTGKKSQINLENLISKLITVLEVDDNSTDNTSSIN